MHVIYPQLSFEILDNGLCHRPSKSLLPTEGEYQNL